MLVKLSCMAIVIAIACFQTGYSASLKHETEETKTSETETTELKDRSKRALYYQNDLISNQERQLRSLGVNYPFYDYYAYPLYPAYDYFYPDIYDQLLAQYALEDYYYYGFPVVPLNAKKEKQQKQPHAADHHDATHNLAGRRGDSRPQPLSGYRQGAPHQGAPYMPSQNFQQHQTFGSHAPHHFKAAAAPAPPTMLAPPAPYMQPFDDSHMQAYQQQRYHDQFEAIKHAAQSGNRRNY